MSDTNNGFSVLLSEMRGGRSLSDLSEAVAQCVAAVKDTGKAAKLVYTMIITPRGNAVVLGDKVETKLPLPARDESVFFTTQENTLTRRDPNQQELNLREVERPQVEARTVPAAVVPLAG